MILPNIFTKKYHRSIMISIEVSLNHMMHHKKTRNYSQLNIENYNLLAQNSAQESPHEMGIQCPQYGQ